MTTERRITASWAGLIEHLREKEAEHRSTSKSARTQRDAAYRKGIADGLRLAVRILEDTTLVPESEVAALPTYERLARDLEAAGAPHIMVERARAKVYDDVESPLSRPQHELHEDLLRAGLDTLARDVRRGRWEREDS